jgi:hypothetical protein
MQISARAPVKSFAGARSVLRIRLGRAAGRGRPHLAFGAAGERVHLLAVRLAAFNAHRVAVHQMCRKALVTRGPAPLLESLRSGAALGVALRSSLRVRVHHVLQLPRCEELAELRARRKRRERGEEEERLPHLLSWASLKFSHLGAVPKGLAFLARADRFS